MDGLYLQLSKWVNEFSFCEQFSSYKNKCRDFLKHWPVASKIMDGPFKMNTEWSVWPVHVLGPVRPAFFNRHSPTLVCFYSIRNVLPCYDENRKTEIITNQIFHFLVVIFRFAVIIRRLPISS